MTATNFDPSAPAEKSSAQQHLYPSTSVLPPPPPYNPYAADATTQQPYPPHGDYRVEQPYPPQGHYVTQQPYPPNPDNATPPAYTTPYPQQQPNAIPQHRPNYTPGGGNSCIPYFFLGVLAAVCIGPCAYITLCIPDLVEKMGPSGKRGFAWGVTLWLLILLIGAVVLVILLSLVYT